MIDTESNGFLLHMVGNSVRDVPRLPDIDDCLPTAQKINAWVTVRGQVVLHGHVVFAEATTGSFPRRQSKDRSSRSASGCVGSKVILQRPEIDQPIPLRLLGAFKQDAANRALLDQSKNRKSTEPVYPLYSADLRVLTLMRFLGEDFARFDMYHS